jgi:TPR repeat protein
MIHITNYKIIIYICLPLLLLTGLYEIISRPYEPNLFQRDRHEMQDSKFEPVINALIELPLPRLEELGYKADAKSQYLVGMRYQFGTETFPDSDKAIIWYQRSADGGEPAGMYWLSIINNNLTISQKNELLQKSAKLGYWRAKRDVQLNDLSTDFLMKKNKY